MKMTEFRARPGILAGLGRGTHGHTYSLEKLLKRLELPAPADRFLHRYEQPAMPGADEVAQIENAASALHLPRIGVHIQRPPVGIGQAAAIDANGWFARIPFCSISVNQASFLERQEACSIQDRR